MVKRLYNYIIFHLFLAVKSRTYSFQMENEKTCFLRSNIVAGKRRFGEHDATRISDGPKHDC